MKRGNAKNWMMMILAGACCAMVSCDDTKTENEPPVLPDATAVIGQYSGKMAVVEVTPQTEEQPIGTAVEVSVTGDKIVFSDFPIRDLVVKIVGEESADAIVELVGKVSYEIPYSALLSDNKATVKMTLAPDPLKLTLTLPAPSEGGDESDPIEIEVAVTVATDGIYAISTNELRFLFAVEGVAVAGVPLPDFKGFTLGFDLEK